MWALSRLARRSGTSGLAPFFAFRGISTQTCFIAVANGAHPSSNFSGHLPLCCLKAQCGRVWLGRKWKRWRGGKRVKRGGRSHKPAAGGCGVGDVRLDGGSDGYEGSEAQLQEHDAGGVTQETPRDAQGRPAGAPTKLRLVPAEMRPSAQVDLRQSCCHAGTGW